ncbi:hypothetical protein GW793_01900 [bacterium]|uniref:Uncharacterized protein n=2 Tax=Katanobacteria TaxID=422282 RepID=A0A2M7X5J8_UNCKA|nr:hypothetical protein [bacterium]PIP56530.1 MAG: hypothetical protein COX05_02565 [candidate division WWE3 bacterium CG22_combo_CG10-13_8_21_14_all_39_12]PJA41407.1 MAG: hypothetical protein CO179_00045 [candidate division WWE3 bacterium CG_4_9_14_3_um_filter_39_7]
MISKKPPKELRNNVTKRQIILRVILLIVVILLVSAGISGYFLIYKPYVDSRDTPPKATPTPTPIPEYLEFLQTPANFVGEIERIDTLQDTVTVVRDDRSRIQLTLNPFTKIYVVSKFQPQNVRVEITDQNILQENMTVSIYTNDKNITALFVLEPDQLPTNTPAPSNQQPGINELNTLEGLN